MSHSHWVDVTILLSPATPVWPGDPPVHVTAAASLKENGYIVSLLSLGTHAGTHVDFPGHMIAGGGGPADAGVDVLCGAAEVVDVTGCREIGAAMLAERILTTAPRILLRTQNSGWSSDEFMAPSGGVTTDGAEYLIARGTVLVGIDASSIEDAGSDTHEVHQLLFRAGIPIIECLDLAAAPTGPCELFCLPLLLDAPDAAPARVVLRYETDLHRVRAE